MMMMMMKMIKMMNMSDTVVVDDGWLMMSS